MKFAAIARCPVTFGTIKSFDKLDAEKVVGVEEIFELERIIPPTGQFFGALGGVVVVANNTWAAFQGKSALDIEWNTGENGNFNSDEFKEKLTQRVHRQGKVVPGSKGNVTTAFEEAENIVEATYHVPFLVHAPMGRFILFCIFSVFTLTQTAVASTLDDARAKLSALFN